MHHNLFDSRSVHQPRGEKQHLGWSILPLTAKSITVEIARARDARSDQLCRYVTVLAHVNDQASRCLAKDVSFKSGLRTDKTGCIADCLSKWLRRSKDGVMCKAIAKEAQGKFTALVLGWFVDCFAHHISWVMLLLYAAATDSACGLLHKFDLPEQWRGGNLPHQSIPSRFVLNPNCGKGVKGRRQCIALTMHSRASNKSR